MIAIKLLTTKGCKDYYMIGDFTPFELLMDVFRWSMGVPF